MKLVKVTLEPRRWTRFKLAKRVRGTKRVAYRYCATGAALRALGVQPRDIVNRGSVCTLPDRVRAKLPNVCIYWSAFTAINDAAHKLTPKVVEDLNEMARSTEAPFRFVWGGK